MADSITNPQILLALAIGIVPSLFWLFIWLRTDRTNPEPFGLLLLTFILGGISVLFATLLQHQAKDLMVGATERIALFAAIEEVVKFGVFLIIAARNDYNDEAIDPAIYMIAAALGFAALENILYVLKPGLTFNVTAALLTGGLRFLGSTLLHTIASALVGIIVGLMRRTKFIGALFGLGLATLLHATFNFFVLNNNTDDILRTYGFLWVAGIISLLVLEKLRRIPIRNTVPIH